jgi:hypothetical protein
LSICGSALQVHHNVHLFSERSRVYVRKSKRSPTNCNAVLSYRLLMQDFCTIFIVESHPDFCCVECERSKNAILMAKTLNEIYFYMYKVHPNVTHQVNTLRSLAGNTWTTNCCSNYRVLEAGGPVTGPVQSLPSCGKRVKNHATNQRRSE